jgi:hypothetical protein
MLFKIKSYIILNDYSRWEEYSGSIINCLITVAAIHCGKSLHRIANTARHHKAQRPQICRIAAVWGRKRFPEAINGEAFTGMTEFLNGRLDALTICKTAVGWHDARGCFGINGIYNVKGKGERFTPIQSFPAVSR